MRTPEHSKEEGGGNESAHLSQLAAQGRPSSVSRRPLIKAKVRN